MRNTSLLFVRTHPFLSAILMALLVAPARPQLSDEWKAWNQPVEPFRVIGNIYYVGAKEVSSFLITTPKGHILLDSGFAETVPIIQESLKKLGFKIEDVKVLINSHAHVDHGGGLALLKELTGAKLMVSEADAALLGNGGRGDFAWGDKYTYKPVKADRMLRDNDKVESGAVTMTAHLTPGHTKGCTTWSMKVEDGGKQLDVVFVGSTTIPGYKLVGNEKYPGIIADYARSFEVLKSLNCDVFLANHGSFFALLEKIERLKRGGGKNPFIDPASYKNYIEETEKTYRDHLAKEQKAG